MWFLEDPGETHSHGFDLTKLKVDEAYLRVKSSDSRRLTLYSLSHQCYGCPLTPLLEVGGVIKTNSTSLSTRHPWTFLLTTAKGPHLPEESKGLCAEREVKVGQFGVYSLNFNPGGVCSFETLKPPVFEYGALVLAFAVYVGLALLAVALLALYRRLGLSLNLARVAASETQVNGLQMVVPTSAITPPDREVTSKPGKPRLKSLDTFRGITIILMIFVNGGGRRYWFFGHAVWHGLLLADLVFPWFMWIMGVCIPLCLSHDLRRGTPRSIIFAGIVKRSIKFFLLGIVMNSFRGRIWLDKYRIPGVMQRFCACYFVTYSVALAFTPTQPQQYQSDAGIAVSDMLQLLPQWVVHLLIVATHTLITFLLPVPGCPTGYQGPGGLALLQNGTSSPQCIGGAARVVDTWLLTSSHIYQNPLAKTVYESGAFDPEGVLGTLTSIFQVFLGVQAGVILEAYTSHRDRLVRWLSWGALLGVVGAGLCGASVNDGVIPLNKNLWSLSYVLVTSCFAFFLLAFCYLLVDVRGTWTGSPFFQAGMNSIFLYVAHNATASLFPWHYKLGLMNTHLVHLFENLWGTTLWVLIAIYLHHKGKFFTL